jgi:hypothetical protein
LCQETLHDFNKIFALLSTGLPAFGLVCSLLGNVRKTVLKFPESRLSLSPADL